MRERRRGGGANFHSRSMGAGALWHTHMDDFVSEVEKMWHEMECLRKDLARLSGKMERLVREHWAGVEAERLAKEEAELARAEAELARAVQAATLKPEWEHWAAEVERLERMATATGRAWYKNLAELYEQAFDSEYHAQLVRDYEHYLAVVCEARKMRREAGQAAVEAEKAAAALLCELRPRMRLMGVTLY